MAPEILIFFIDARSIYLTPIFKPVKRRLKRCINKQLPWENPIYSHGQERGKFTRLK